MSARTMCALAKIRPEPGLDLVEVPLPAVGHNDVRIRITQAAICGTDVHIYNWDSWARATLRLPLVIGHEYVGVIDALGQEVRGFAVGDRVSGEGHVTCGHCRNCRAGRRHLCRNARAVGVDRDGAFAEYLVIPASNAFPIPEGIGDDLAAIFDPLGNAVHTALSFDLVGEDVLITGAGPIGAMAAAVARHAGARHVVVTDFNPYRLELAARLGATRTVRIDRENLPEVEQRLGMTEGFDVGLEMSGAPEALELMLETINHGGRIALLGIPSGPRALDWSRIIFKGLTLKGIYGREMFETWYKMANLVLAGLPLQPLITHRFSMDRYEEAFEVMRSGRSGKVLLSWS